MDYEAEEALKGDERVIAEIKRRFKQCQDWESKQRKLFLEDISGLISEFIHTEKPVKEFIQRDKFKSYQLSLNKAESFTLLGRRGTMVLRSA